MGYRAAIKETERGLNLLDGLMKEGSLGREGTKEVSRCLEKVM